MNDNISKPKTVLERDESTTREGVGEVSAFIRSEAHTRKRTEFHSLHTIFRIGHKNYVVCISTLKVSSTDGRKKSLKTQVKQSRVQGASLFDSSVSEDRI